MARELTQPSAVFPPIPRRGGSSSPSPRSSCPPSSRRSARSRATTPTRPASSSWCWRSAEPAAGDAARLGCPRGQRTTRFVLANGGGVTLRGAFAAALTPLRDAGARLDEDAFEPYARFLLDGGVGGILAGGTTGEGIALDPDERLRSVELFSRAGLAVIAHCGAQTTATTVRLPAAPGAAR